MQLLLVSTDPRLTGVVRSALLGLPAADVTLVATPQRALRLLEEGGDFALVVADNDTHPTGGLHLAREVRARARMGAGVPPVVLLLARHQDAWLAAWAEADAHLVKPVDPFDLAEVAAALVDGRPVPALPGVRAPDAAALEATATGGGPAGEA